MTAAYAFIPAAIDYLVANLGITDPKPEQIIDGPPVQELKNSGIAIGYTPDELPVQVRENPSGLASDVVDFDIACIAWVRSGSTDIKVARDDLFVLLDALDQSLNTKHRRLGGAVTHARLLVADLDQLQTPEGVWVTAAIIITCKAFK